MYNSTFIRRENIMYKSRIFYWLRHFRHPNKTEVSSKVIEDVLDFSAQQLRAIDPETDAQWQLMKTAIEKKPGISDTRWIVDRNLFRPAISFAVVTAVLIVVGVVWLNYSSFKTYETAKGQRSSITLSDSTEVTLNYTSKLEVNRWSLQKTRRVSLSGEAFFHVRRNCKPFIITTDVGTVQVLGTQFNVRMRDDRMEVAVLNGSVKVSVHKNGIDSSVVLSKGQIAVCSKGDFPEMPGTLPFTEYPGWMHGRFMFYRTRLLSACKEVESQFDVVIRIEKAQLQNETITGMIDGQSAETALTTLVQLTGNRFRHENNSYVIY